MIKAGIVLLVLGIITTIVASSMSNPDPIMNYVQAGGFLLGVIGIFLMETNRRKKFKK
ncbi:hypothetical protein [Bacillus massiliigorillae]|uniref:hypothetical protein n=1 Tax=Bacillus massiliigorillae TaxID=1243664 RepID=UPI0003999306|nr:hypothetical protein [Bacillus massiliigorillae]